MSTSSSSQRQVESKPDRSRLEAAGTTKPPAEGGLYGGDQLPVLVRLPDLSRQPRELRLATEPTSAEPAEPAEPTESTESPESATPAGDVETVATRELELRLDSGHGRAAVPAATSTRTAGDRSQAGPAGSERAAAPRRERRAGVDTGRLLGGLGQLAIAVLLAGALFTLIVMFRDRDRPSPAGQGSSAARSAPGTDLAEVPGTPAATVAPVELPDAPQHEPSGDAGLPSLVPPKTVAVPDSQPTQADPQPALDVSDGVADVTARRIERANLPRYPSTGVPPVGPDRPGVEPRSNEFWTESIPVGRIRQARRAPSADGRTQRQ